MKVVISIEHPAWAHQFHYIINNYQKRQSNVMVLAINKDRDIEILQEYGIDYSILENTTGTNVLEKAYLFVKLCFLYTKRVLKFKPDILIGRASPMLAIASFFAQKPHIIFEDTEVSKFSLMICKVFSSCIITPNVFQAKLGHKQRKLPMYKELFYLHPDVFTPDISLLKENGIDTSNQFVIVRFISWNASHDIGKSGLNIKDKISFIKTLGNYVKVYILSESVLPDELISYTLPLPFTKVHHALYYASLVISEGATMASEAVVLGTYAFYLNEIASGTTQEQSDKYKLLRILHDPATRYDIALTEAINLLKRPQLWEENKKKRQKILDDMINPNDTFLAVVQEFIQEKKQ